MSIPSALGASPLCKVDVWLTVHDEVPWSCPLLSAPYNLGTYQPPSPSHSTRPARFEVVGSIHLPSERRNGLLQYSARAGNGQSQVMGPVSL